MKALIFSVICVVTFSLNFSCNDPTSPDCPPDTVYAYRIDTLYLDTLLVTDTLFQFEVDSYYWLFCEGINGVDTLANLWFKYSDPDTFGNGWVMLYFSANPESSIYNAQEFYITHAPSPE